MKRPRECWSECGSEVGELCKFAFMRVTRYVQVADGVDCGNLRVHRAWHDGELTKFAHYDGVW